MTRPTATEPRLFDAYWKRVGELLRADPRHRSTAIRLCGGQPFPVDGVGLVAELMRAMSGREWQAPNLGSPNWAWRGERLDASTPRTREVFLERLIIQTAGLDNWTFQMPTSSGLLGPTKNKRRSIDLVHRHARGRYTFIELKDRADNPLYAAFEILGYGIAYLQARDAGKRGEAWHHVLEAEQVDLMVLGPRSWYCHQARGGSSVRYQLNSLMATINAGLSAAVAGSPDTLPSRMQMHFEEYVGDTDDFATAREIVRLLESRRG